MVGEREGSRLQRVASLLDQMTGPGLGREVLERLLGTDEPAKAIAREIARSPAFGALYKSARTLDVMSAEKKDADPGFVGIPELNQGLAFETLFNDFFRPRLARRADGFA